MLGSVIYEGAANIRTTAQSKKKSKQKTMT